METGKQTKITKPFGFIISKDRAQFICALWHNGLFSALYSFASSKIFNDGIFFKYISEIECNKTATSKDLTDLKKLKRFFEFKHWEENQ